MFLVVGGLVLLLAVTNLAVVVFGPARRCLSKSSSRRS
jgi:hypothetical protein